MKLKNPLLLCAILTLTPTMSQSMFKALTAIVARVCAQKYVRSATGASLGAAALSTAQAEEPKPSFPQAIKRTDIIFQNIAEIEWVISNSSYRKKRGQNRHDDIDDIYHGAYTKQYQHHVFTAENGKTVYIWSFFDLDSYHPISRDLKYSTGSTINDEYTQCERTSNSDDKVTCRCVTTLPLSVFKEKKSQALQELQTAETLVVDMPHIPANPAHFTKLGVSF